MFGSAEENDVRQRVAEAMEKEERGLESVLAGCGEAL